MALYIAGQIAGMNASVESARAGEAGRGVSVIADQIRQLTEMNANYVRQTWESIQKINQSAALLKNV